MKEITVKNISLVEVIWNMSEISGHLAQGNRVLIISSIQPYFKTCPLYIGHGYNVRVTA
jgi:hypothetical protein